MMFINLLMIIACGICAEEVALHVCATSTLGVSLGALTKDQGIVKTINRTKTNGRASTNFEVNL
jgi:hypothetical protein